MSELHINNKFLGLIKFIRHLPGCLSVTLSDGRIVDVDEENLKTMGIVATKENKKVVYKMCLITY